MAESDWQWFGSPGHFICSRYCRFHLCTKVGDYLVSTVGEYVPPESARAIYANSRGVILSGRGEALEADYLNKIGYEPLGPWMDGDGEKPVYETMVFRAGPVCAEPGCNCGMPRIGGGELDTRRCAERGTAQKNHMELCHEYANK